MLRRTVLSLVLVNCLCPMELLRAAPPTSATIVIAQRYRFPNFDLVWPSRVIVSGPGYYHIFNTKDGIKLTVGRMGRYTIDGEYRSPDGKTIKTSTSVTIKKLGEQRAATLLYVP